MKNKQKPEIQFEIIKENWREIKADSIFYSVSDKNHPNLPVLSASQERGMVFRDQIGIDIQYNIESTKTYKRVVPGQFVIHLRSFQGGFAFSNIEGITSPAYTVLDFKDKEKQDSLFWKNIFSSKKFIKRLESVTYGIRDGRSISFNDFSTLKFTVPDYEVQKKIGSFFKDMDKMISLHQQEIDFLKQTERGFLQRIFPKDGESVPEIRFKKFVEMWKEDEFGKVIKLVGGATPSKENKEYWIGDIVWLSSQEIKNKYISKGTYTISKKAVMDNRTKVVPLGTPLIVTRSGILAKRFPISISLNEVAINQDIKALMFDPTKIDTEFIVAQLKSKESYILNNIVKTGTTVQSVNLPDLNQMILHFPSYEEQVKIGNFFKKLDAVIELKEQELKAMKQTKQGFLQKMFV